MAKLRVLVVDDSVVVRRILTDALGADAELQVVTAANGAIALAKLPQVNPDLITLDMEMPVMDGLTTLKEVRKAYPRIPVIMFSTLTERGAAATLDALAAGANDYVTKPANVGSVARAIDRINEELIPKIKALCKQRLPTPPAVQPLRTAVKMAAVVSDRIDVVAIGVSTGGPNALSCVMPLLAKMSVPMVIVQHMPPIFTKLLADRLSQQAGYPIVEASQGMPLKPGHAYIAPGGSHMAVTVVGGIKQIGINNDPPENSCRPAVDVLFRSVASVYGARSLGVILTGMGSDGLRGCECLREAGAQVIVQDEASSVVWGMPGFVARAGLAHKVVPLDQVAAEIIKRTGVSHVRALAS